MFGFPPKQGLYDPRNEHDSCGVGFVANIKGRKSHEVVTAGWLPFKDALREDVDVLRALRESQPSHVRAMFERR